MMYRHVRVLFWKRHLLNFAGHLCMVDCVKLTTYVFMSCKVYKFLSIPTEYEGLPPQRCSSPNSFPFFQIFSVRGRVRGKASDWRARRSLLLDTSLF